MKNSIFMFIYEPQFIADSAVKNPAPQSTPREQSYFIRDLTPKDFTSTLLRKNYVLSWCVNFDLCTLNSKMKFYLYYRMQWLKRDLKP
ncbi:MAG: hypothetical protein O8C67_10985, partial [Candidatus Methanoperedens sp.]|nr:hypothetical protein [Candidatus Methanoperedens sp.]